MDDLKVQRGVKLMRCSCPICDDESFMIHSERDNACVCPNCLYRCYACQGTGTALTREQVLAMKGAKAPAPADPARYFPDFQTKEED